MRGKKELLARYLHRSGALNLLQYMPAWRGPEVRIVTYHRVFDVPDESTFPFDPALISASTAAFREQIDYIAARFAPVSFADVLTALDGGTPLPRRAVVITFDDGHADNYTHAFPVLQSAGMPAAIFLSTGYIGGDEVFWFDRVWYLIFRTQIKSLAIPGIRYALSLADVPSRRQAAEVVLDYLKGLSNDRRLETIDWLAHELAVLPREEDAGLSGAMNWDQIREMSRAGIEFGSHAVSHPMLTQLDDVTLNLELVDSRATIEREIGKAVVVIAYPEGGTRAFDTRVTDAAKRAGYRLGLSYMPGAGLMRRINRFAVPRLQIERTTSWARFRSMLELPGLFALEIGGPNTRIDTSTSRTANTKDLRLGANEIPLREIDAGDSHGWHILLGSNLTGRMLCVDLAPSSPSNFFESFYAEVHSIDLTTACQNPLAVSNAETLCEVLEIDWLPRFGDSSIDAFVLHDLDGIILNSRNEVHLRRMMMVVHRMLRPEGFCYLGFRNASALFRTAHEASRGQPLRLDIATRVLSSAGFAPNKPRFHAYLLAGQRVLEVLPSRGYTSVKNSRNWKERVKEYCYGRFGAKRWAPAYGVIASKSLAAPSVVEQLAERLRALSGTGTTKLEMLRCQLLWRKVILSFGSPECKYGSLVVIYTSDPQAIARRELEANILEHMAPHVPTLTDRLPKVLSQGTLNGNRYFVLSEFAGMTIDRAYHGTHTATQNAAQFLAELHSVTSERHQSSREFADEMIGNLFGHAVARYPVLEPHIARLACLVKQRAMGHDWPSVWQHGDYKLENVILNPLTLSVVGVIDWELSIERGLPVLDMLYLIAYNRSINQDCRISDVYRSVILPWKFTKDEQRMLDEYQRSLGLERVDSTLWAAIYLIHDVGVRYTFNLALHDERARLEQLLLETTAALEIGSATYIANFAPATGDRSAQ